MLVNVERFFLSFLYNLKARTTLIHHTFDTDRTMLTSNQTE